MTATTAETLTVDGVNLKTLATNIETLAATLRSPGKRGANAIVANRDGSLFTPYKPTETGTLFLPMWVAGCDVDGAIPGGSSARKEFFKNLDMITALFDKDYALLDVRHILPDGTTRQAMCDVLQSIDFSSSGWGEPVGKFAVELSIPGAFWQDVIFTNPTATALINTNWTWGTGGTAPINDGVFTITGPSTNSQVVDVTSGAWFKYAGSIGAGQTLIVDCDNFAVSGTGGLNPDMTKVQYYRTGGRLMRVTPSRTSLDYILKHIATGTSAATRLALNARKKYKVG